MRCCKLRLIDILAVHLTGLVLSHLTFGCGRGGLYAKASCLSELSSECDAKNRSLETLNIFMTFLIERKDYFVAEINLQKRPCGGTATSS